MELRRDNKILLHPFKDKKFKITDKLNNELVNETSEFNIYMKNINFNNGVIEGRYLGNCKGFIVNDSQERIIYDGENFKVNNEILKTAKMIVVNNKKEIVLIIK